MIESYNQGLACEAPELRGVERKVTAGVALAMHQTSLKELKVVFGNGRIRAGARVWIPAILLTNQKWASEVHEVEGKKVVFVPESGIVLVEQPEEKPVTVRDLLGKEPGTYACNLDKYTCPGCPNHG